MPLPLEDFSMFSIGSSGKTADHVSSSQADAVKAEAFENGYKAGWDDSAQTVTDEQARIDAEFARHFQEMSFSFHEARTHLIQAMEPLLRELVETFLPALVRETIGQRIIETLEPMISDCADSPVSIAVAIGCESIVEPYLSASDFPFVQIVEEETLSEGQAFLRLGSNERKIDLTDAIDQITQSIHATSQLNERALNHA